METPQLTSDAFWRSHSVHLALPSGAPDIPPGLLEAATPHLPEGGCLFRTSGSQGEPKWVALEKRAFLHSARVVNAHYDLIASDHWLIALPLHHVGGFAICARAWLAGSRVSHLPGKWDPPALVRRLEEEGITALSLVPTQVHDLVRDRLPAPPALRVVLVGGGALSPSLARQALALGWKIRATYGMTETASAVAAQPLEQDLSEELDLIKVLPHWHVSTDETGILIVRGPSLAKGCLAPSGPHWEWQPIDPATGLRTRDRVTLTRNGTRAFLRFEGREDTFVKIVGELVHLDQLEKRLRSLAPLGFPELALLAAPDPRRESRLILVIEGSTHSPQSVETLLQHFAAASAPFEQIDHWQAVPAFPRSALGKLQRPLLAAALLEAS